MIRDFIADRRGNFGAAFAVVAMGMIAVAGGSIDLSYRERMETKLQDVVDAATLAGATAAMAGADKAAQEEEVRRYFNQNCEVADCTAKMNLEIDIQDTYIGVASLGPTKTFFMGMMGVSELKITAKARVNLGRSHVEVHMLLDNTGSMNIVDGLSNIVAFRTQYLPYEKHGWADTCAFACHDSADGDGRDVTYNGMTGADFARSLGIPLREDRVKSEMIEQADRLLKDGKGTIKVAVYDFDWAPREHQKPTTDFARVKTAINGIAGRSIGTQYDKMSEKFDPMVGPSGTGTAKDPRKAIVMITDGISQNLSTYEPELISTAACDRLKKDGRELYVLNIAYPDVDEVGNGLFAYKDIVRALQPQLEPALQACASPGKYFRADYGVSIENALKAITDDLTRSNKMYLAM